ncbi:DinB family protein [Chitinilyticum piscinae]|uniref:Damage-inducible protein DinB n=1 Tax=Chitinilyticum piscinae TaxID=2866724 RepID=A0A8J7FGS2_9NEIS|nr:DinB family protein [Chitinilyticum piscinae]MBE9609123.1 damage-inducible protein DinB [Chitinilyticum piscinae]
MFNGNMPQLMAAYNQWQNAKLFDACLQLGDDERKADRGAFFQSIHHTLNHILWADLNWMGRFTGIKPELPPLGEDIHADFAALHAARLELDARIVAWAGGLSSEWLNEPVTWSSVLYKFTQTIPRWVQVQHFFNHQTHHRAQVGTLLMQAGIDIGITDLPMLPMLPMLNDDATA